MGSRPPLSRTPWRKADLEAFGGSRSWGCPGTHEVLVGEDETMAKQQTRSDEVAKHEQELAEYLQERIKPGLNRGAIPLLARSIAKEITNREQLDGGSEDAEADDQPAAEAHDDAEAGDEGEAAEEDYDDDDEDGDQDESDAEADNDYEDEVEDAEKDDEPRDEGDAPLDDFEAEMH